MQYYLSTDPKSVRVRAAVEKARSSIVDIAVDGGCTSVFAGCFRAAKGRQGDESLDRRRGGALGIAQGIYGRSQYPTQQKFQAGRRTRRRHARPQPSIGAKKNVVVHLENDNPISEDPFFIVQIIEHTGCADCRTSEFIGRA